MTTRRPTRPAAPSHRAAPEGQWYAMAAVQNSGLALDWVRRMLGVEWSRLFATMPMGRRRRALRTSCRT
ncbi:MAG: hypothetical protein U0869_05080 [Chloroflexota bacterium]